MGNTRGEIYSLNRTEPRLIEINISENSEIGL